MPVEKFKTSEGYRRWNAYRHIHGIDAPNLDEVVVGSKRHKVKHSGRKVSKRSKRGRSRGRTRS